MIVTDHHASEKYALVSVKEGAVFFMIFATLLFISHIKFADPIGYDSDDMRYINYAFNIHEYGIFGVTTDGDFSQAASPGNANAPLYLYFITGIMAFDSGLSETIKCVLNNSSDFSHCPQNVQIFFFVQYALGLVSLFLIFLTARVFSQKRSVAWLSAIAAFMSMAIVNFATIFMTEIMIMPLFFGLAFLIALNLKKPKLMWICGMGILLALMTLTRPSYLYLFYSFVLLFIGAGLWHRSRENTVKLAVLILAFCLIVSPWALRNKMQFDSISLTTGQYAEIILSERISYNQMNWGEWLAAFVYWLPDFGDSLAEDLFPEELYKRLSWGAGSYYEQGRKEFYPANVENAGGQDKVLGYIIRHELIGNMFKHIMVSLPLAWRGVFIFKYWGLIGFMCFVALLIQTLRKRDYSLLIISAPFIFMVAFHAGLSVSIPRYNAPIMMLYALGMAWYINMSGQNITRKIYAKLSRS